MKKRYEYYCLTCDCCLEVLDVDRDFVDGCFYEDRKPRYEITCKDCGNEVIDMDENLDEVDR